MEKTNIEPEAKSKPKPKNYACPVPADLYNRLHKVKESTGASIAWQLRHGMKKANKRDLQNLDDIVKLGLFTKEFQPDGSFILRSTPKGNRIMDASPTLVQIWAAEEKGDTQLLEKYRKQIQEANTKEGLPIKNYETGPIF